MDLDEKELEEMHRRKMYFVYKYGPHSIATDMELLIDTVYRYHAREKVEGFMTVDQREMLIAFRHLAVSTVEHKKNREELNCHSCKRAYEIVDAIKAGEM